MPKFGNLAFRKKFGAPLNFWPFLQVKTAKLAIFADLWGLFKTLQMGRPGSQNFSRAIIFHYLQKKLKKNLKIPDFGSLFDTPRSQLPPI